MSDRNRRRCTDLDDTGEHKRTWVGWLGQRSIKDWLLIAALFAAPGQYVVTAVYHHTSSLFMDDKHLVTTEALDARLEPIIAAQEEASRTDLLILEKLEALD